ncbi:MAG: CsbD family protein [Rhodopila sp.]|jgi:uncharacterized protein YjbJ (UPF0337 family)
MTNSRIDGVGHQVKGALKEGLGKLIGDAKLKADGAAERAAGAAQNAASADGDPLIGIDADRIKGVGHQIKGAMKEGLGNITNDLELKAAGIAEREAGVTQNAAGSARDEARAAPKP